MSIATYEPLSLSAEEQKKVSQLEKKLGPEAPALVGPDGEKLVLPARVYELFRRAVQLMARGQAVTLVPDRQALTTQRAANLLGMSRPFFVKLLESRVIPFHRVGNQRRVYLSDVIAYGRKRDQERFQALDEMARDAFSMGLYDENVLPEGGSDT